MTSKTTSYFIILFALSLLTSCGAGRETDDIFSINDDDLPINPKLYEIELTAPSDNSIYGVSGPASFPIVGTCSGEDQNLAIFVDGTLRLNLTCTGGTITDTLQRAWLSEGANTIIAVYTVFPSSDVISITLDTVIPTITYDAIANVDSSNQGNYSFSGSCSDNGRQITGDFSGYPFSTNCIGGAWTVSNFDTSIFGDGSYTITARTTDLAGNASGNITTPVTKDTSAPFPSLAFISPVSGYGNSGAIDIRMSNVIATDTINIFLNDATCLAVATLTEVSGGATHDMTLPTVAEATYRYYYTVPAQTGGTCLGPLVYTEDLTDPTDPLTVTMSSPNDGEVSSDPTPLFSGTINTDENGSTVNVYRDMLCSDLIGNGLVSEGEFNVLTSLALDGSQNGVNQFYIKVVDRAGNEGSCFDTGLSYDLSAGGLATLPKLAMVGVDSVSRLVSLEDNNTITWTRKAAPGTPITFGPLDAGDVILIEDPGNTADKVDQGDLIESTAACYVVTGAFGTAPWASEAYSGRVFTSHQYRYGGNSPKIFVASLVAEAFVQIKQDQDGNGTLETIAFATIAKNDTHEFTVALTDGRPFQVVSNQNINAFYVSESGDGNYTRDARVLTPAARDIIGYSFYITSTENDTTVNSHRFSVGANILDTDLDIFEFIDNGRTLKSNLNDYAARVIADKPVSMLQIADQDGINATPSLPVTMLATHYGIPSNADYVGIIATGPTNYYYTLPGQAEVGPIALSAPANVNPNAPYAAKFTDGATIAAGTLIRCDNPCYMIYDDEQLGDRDETLMMGFSP